MLKARHIRHPVRAARGAEQLLRLHLSALRRARDLEQIYRGDPRFRLEAVEQGFGAHLDSQSNDTELLRRICEAYKAATRAPKSDIYEPTEWWAAIRRTSLQPVIRALETADVESLQRMYANFFRDPCSDGLVGKTLLLRPSVTRPFTRFHQAIYLTEALVRVDYWKRLTQNRYALSELGGPAVGNPFGVTLEGVLIRTGAEHQHYCAQKIAGLLDAPDSVVFEVGGGFGGMAYYLLRGRQQIRYLNFDLPESIALAAYYLIKSFPEKRFLLCGETSGKSIASEHFDVALLPVSQISATPSRYADLVVSSHAMSDLKPAALSTYLEHIGRATKRYLLCESMYLATGRIRNAIRAHCPGFLLKQERHFSFYGPNGVDSQQCELLYESSRY